MYKVEADGKNFLKYHDFNNHFWCIYVILMVDFTWQPSQKWTFTIMAHVLPIDQYVLGEKIGAVLGNFANVPSTGWEKLKWKMTIVY